ncbi:hypothetical protein ACQEVF_07965 [Nonomuraea polychroma]|uniref:hypothetical protein n=1 Tax=Nonomuraea polychroma TaxID=46176 RepID=UPI003D911831
MTAGHDEYGLTERGEDLTGRQRRRVDDRGGTDFGSATTGASARLRGKPSPGAPGIWRIDGVLTAQES